MGVEFHLDLPAFGRGDWRGFNDNKRNPLRGMGGGRGAAGEAKKPKCIHSEPGEGSWELNFGQRLAA